MENIIKRYEDWIFEKGISGSVIKMIAMITMLIDHIGAILIENELIFPGCTTLYWITRSIGRISFPLFAFLIAEGIAHTECLYKYFIRISIFAIICQLPYAFAFNTEMRFLNIFFTFFFAMLPFLAYEYIQNDIARIIFTLIIAGSVFIILDGSQVHSILEAIGIKNNFDVAYMHPDYGWKGICLVWLFYILRRYRPFNVLIFIPFMLYVWRGNHVQMIAVASTLIILLYNGQRGFIRSKVQKYACYAFYPAHLLALFGIYLLLK